MDITELLSFGGSKKRSLDLSSLEVTRALTWDPVTEEVWLCDANTGDIIRCNSSMSQITSCVVALDATTVGSAGEYTETNVTSLQ